jgi:hypothetical protein
LFININIESDPVYIDTADIALICSVNYAKSIKLLPETQTGTTVLVMKKNFNIPFIFVDISVNEFMALTKECNGY